MKTCSDIPLRICISNSHHSVGEIEGENLVVEEQTNVRNGGCFLKQAFVEKGTIYGIDTLQEGARKYKLNKYANEA